jgi:aspartate aminotransferase
MGFKRPGTRQYVTFACFTIHTRRIKHLQETYAQMAETLIGSEIVKLGNMIRQRKAVGETIYNFTIGDFDSQIFPLPEALEAAIIEAYRQGHTSYPLAEG